MQLLLPAHFAIYFIVVSSHYNIMSTFQATYCVVWIFFGSSQIFHLRTCTYLSGLLERTIWNFVVPFHSLKRLTPFASVHISLIIFKDIVYTRLSLSHHVDVFQCDQKCVIVCVVKLQSRIFIFQKLPIWTANLLLYFLLCRLLRFQQHLVARGFICC